MMLQEAIHIIFIDNYKNIKVIILKIKKIFYTFAVRLTNKRTAFFVFT